MSQVPWLLVYMLALYAGYLLPIPSILLVS